MAPFAESRNFRGWWTSKTPLEQKLVILSSILFILSFCLTISVIVLANKKPPACGGSTTSVPSTETTEVGTTLPTETEPPETTTVAEETTTTEKPPKQAAYEDGETEPPLLDEGQDIDTIDQNKDDEKPSQPVENVNPPSPKQT